MIAVTTGVPPTAMYNQFDLYKTFEVAKPNLDGSIGYTPGININDLFSLAFMKNDLSVLSRVQRKDMEKYILQSGGNLSNDMVQLDNYLGGLINA